MNLQTMHWVILFAFGAMVVNTIGIWLMHRYRDWAERSKEYFMCFAAGVLIATPFLIAFPEAVEKNNKAGLAALVGFFYMFLSNKLIQKRTKQSELAFGITALQGIGIHSFVDGMIYAVTFSVSVMSGLLAGIGLVIHELAEGAITYAFLIKGGVKERKALLFAFLIAALTTPLGALVAYPIVYRLSEPILGLLLGFVVGVLIYVSAAHLLPEATEAHKKHSFATFSLGVLFAVLLSFVHTH